MSRARYITKCELPSRFWPRTLPDSILAHHPCACSLKTRPIPTEIGVSGTAFTLRLRIRMEIGTTSRSSSDVAPLISSGSLPLKGRDQTCAIELRSDSLLIESFGPGAAAQQSSREFWTFGPPKNFQKVQKSKRLIGPKSRFRSINAERKNACQNRRGRLLDRFNWGPPLCREIQNSPVRGAVKNRLLTTCFALPHLGPAFWAKWPLWRRDQFKEFIRIPDH